MRGQVVDFSHRINHISFGDESSVKSVRKLTKITNLAPLDGLTATTTSSEGHGHHAFTTYYLTVTPAKYNINSQEYFVHEFTQSSQTVLTHNYPAVYFRY